MPLWAAFSHGACLQRRQGAVLGGAVEAINRLFQVCQQPGRQRPQLFFRQPVEAVLVELFEVVGVEVHDWVLCIPGLFSRGCFHIDYDLIARWLLSTWFLGLSMVR